MPWYAAHRDLPRSPFATTRLYRDLDELRTRSARAVAAADLVVLGSYVPEGVEVARWMLQVATGVRAFYDIDTPVTLAKLRSGDHEYLTPGLVPRFDLYLSFAGGPVLNLLADEFGALRPRPLYCSVDPDVHRARTEPRRWDLGYMGTYSAGSPAGPRGLAAGARPRVAGPSLCGRGAAVPAGSGVAGERRAFRASAAGAACVLLWRAALYAQSDPGQHGGRRWSPSVRLFEAAATGTPIVSDAWPGLKAFFEPGEEILIAHSSEQVVSYLSDLDETKRQAIAAAAKAAGARFPHPRSARAGARGLRRRGARASSGRH